ncbi:MAG: hypothetical protein ACLQHF_14435 [Terracidiphilus sp.]
MIRIRVAAAFLALAAFTFAQNPSPKTAPVPVHGQGCVASGVEAGCLVLKDSGSGILYDLLISGARPQVGEGIEFTGIPHDGPTICMQGTPVKVTQWARKDSIKCPPNETPSKGSGKQ